MADVVHVFDLDDTLYLEREYVRSGFAHINRVAKSLYGIDALGDRAWELFESGIRRRTFDLLAEEYELPRSSVSLMIDEYRHHRPTIALEPDAVQYLELLDRASVAIITDGHARSQWEKIRALRLDQYVHHVVVTADHGPTWTKPSERAFTLVASRFPSGSKLTYYADNPAKDFQAPLTLGWDIVRVRRPLGLHHAVEDASTSEFSVADFSDLVGRDS